MDWPGLLPPGRSCASLPPTRVLVASDRCAPVAPSSVVTSMGAEGSIWHIGIVRCGARGSRVLGSPVVLQGRGLVGGV